MKFACRCRLKSMVVVQVVIAASQVSNRDAASYLSMLEYTQSMTKYQSRLVAQLGFNV